VLDAVPQAQVHAHLGALADTLLRHDPGADSSPGALHE
jgi:hypothetical protein